MGEKKHFSDFERGQDGCQRQTAAQIKSQTADKLCVFTYSHQPGTQRKKVSSKQKSCGEKFLVGVKMGRLI